MDSATSQFVRHRAGNRSEYCRLSEEFSFVFTLNISLLASMAARMTPATWHLRARSVTFIRAQISPALIGYGPSDSTLSPAPGFLGQSLQAR
jgi:hypothetical protein